MNAQYCGAQIVYAQLSTCTTRWPAIELVYMITLSMNLQGVGHLHGLGGHLREQHPISPFDRDTVTRKLIVRRKAGFDNSLR